MSIVKNLVRDLRKARVYTEDMLSNVDQADWFRQPSEGVTHIAWQVGHLAVAQFSLALKRVRGEKTGNGKEAAIRWSIQHEFIHAGQIGLLRRLLGANPLR